MSVCAPSNAKFANAHEITIPIPTFIRRVFNPDGSVADNYVINAKILNADININSDLKMLKLESLYTLYEHIQQKQQKTVISKFESTLNDALKVQPSEILHKSFYNMHFILYIMFNS